jgi:hypothetical protein
MNLGSILGLGGASGLCWACNMQKQSETNFMKQGSISTICEKDAKHCV